MIKGKIISLSINGKNYNFTDIGNSTEIETPYSNSLSKRGSIKLNGTLINQDGHFFRKIQNKIISAIHDDMEESVLACMAAGIPSNLMSVVMPSIVYDKGSYHYRSEGTLSFTGRLH